MYSGGWMVNQIIHQIYLKILDDVCLVANYYLVKKNVI